MYLLEMFCVQGLCTELFIFFRNTKLWICMEYCGGGSLQDIYQGIHCIKLGLVSQTDEALVQLFKSLF